MKLISIDRTAVSVALARQATQSRHVAQATHSLARYVTADDHCLDRETFLRTVAERILDDLDAKKGKS
jgi:hypothetical protein